MSPFARQALAHPGLDRLTEQHLARRAAAGDREARERLISAGLRWVVLHALRRGRIGTDFDDAVQDGIVALIGAVDRFDPERNVRLVTFAWAAIDGAMAVRPPVPVAPDRVVECVGGPVDDLLDGLHDSDAQLLRIRFGLGQDRTPRSRREVAAVFGLTESEVRTRERRALDRLRRQWSRPGFASSGRDC
ncbi:sigma factor [uncultured Aeromicrobium sp.]|uniref:sigma factor n=1 Tax=uncultured Aeromicrobium sp. TaxID=337820 RepID=UPI0025D6B92B|nr:sigma factor [uncultured Aeromicrobium sp.]